MKWREPWSVSLKQQQRFNLFGKEMLRGAILWTAILVAVGLLANLGEDIATQLERTSRLWIAPAIGVPLGLLIYVTGWLSPRQIDSGPNGIVIVKGDQISLIYWPAIESYMLGRDSGHNVLHIADESGGRHTLFLADKVQPQEVERELVRMTGKHGELTLQVQHP
ncbi:hypothetical protein [Luteimonas sp. A482]